jgi:membrane-associated protease RseP (regulator of RpoE activity)
MGVAAAISLAPPAALAQSRQLVQILQEPNPLLRSNISQGYLGVDLSDVDQEKAQSLKLKEVRGAIITLIDHDAPAGQVGLKVNDVVLQLNGQPVEGAEQLRRMLREIPAGRKITLEISRDGSVQTMTVALVDRRAMEHDIWNKLGNNGDVFPQASGMGILAGAGDAPMPGSLRMSIFGSSLNVGAMVEPLTSQMSDYLGVQSGLMVKQVARKSEAATAGLKAFDVILKVGQDPISTLADWDRSLRANQGKPVQVTILRDKKQQTVTLQVDSKRHGKLEMEELFPAGECPLVAQLDPDEVSQFAQRLAGDESALQSMRNQAEALKDQLGNLHVEISPEQAEAMREQAERLRDAIKIDDFKLDQKQLDQLNRQMEEFRQNFKPEDFKLDPKHMEELQKQMEQMKRQLEDMKALGFGDHI